MPPPLKKQKTKTKDKPQIRYTRFYTPPHHQIVKTGQG